MSTGRVYGNKGTKVVHDLKNKDACRVSEIKASNRVQFESLKLAVEAGYNPCRVCFAERFA